MYDVLYRNVPKTSEEQKLKTSYTETLKSESFSQG